MTDYDELFDQTAPEESVFADKSAFDPLAEPEEIVAREDQQTRLARLLNVDYGDTSEKRMTP